MFFHCRVTGACSVTTDLIMRVNVRTTRTTTTTTTVRAFTFIKPERSQTTTQGVVNLTRGVLWLKLILDPASSMPVSWPHTPHPTQRYHLLQTLYTNHHRALSGTGTRWIWLPPQQGREGPLGCVLWWAATTVVVSSSRLSPPPGPRTLVLRFVCRHPPALVLPIMYVSCISRFTVMLGHAHSRVL